MLRKDTYEPGHHPGSRGYRNPRNYKRYRIDSETFLFLPGLVAAHGLLGAADGAGC